MHACARRLFARLASEIFLSDLNRNQALISEDIPNFIFSL